MSYTCNCHVALQFVLRMQKCWQNIDFWCYLNPFMHTVVTAVPETCAANCTAVAPSVEKIENKFGHGTACEIPAFPSGLTTPSGSTRSRCLGWPPCCPVSTYCPGVVPDSRTRKSPSRPSSLSASLRLKLPWNQVSHCSCSTRGGAAVTEPPRASSNGSLKTGGIYACIRRTRCIDCIYNVFMYFLALFAICGNLSGMVKRCL